VKPTNREIAALLQELADLLELDEGSPQAFRVRAYERAATAVRDAPTPVADMTTAELQRLEGIGKSTAEKIATLAATGRLDRLDALRAKYPPGFVEITKIPGLGPKTVVMLRDRLGIETVEQLEAALAAHGLRELPGLGAKSEEKIARAIERLGLGGKEQRTPIIQALPIAHSLVRTLGELPQVERVEYCGSLRRFRDTIGDVDIVVASTDPGPVMDAFVALPVVTDVLGHGLTKSSIVTRTGLQVDLRVVAPDQYGAAVVYFTGSKQHNIELRQRAIARGWTLNEYALADAESGEVVAAATEEDIYRALGLDFVPPELREGHEEIALAAAGDLPRLVTEADIRGDLHVHSTWSGDGRSSLDDMVARAAARGLEYIAITEHGEDLAINGLSREAVMTERAEIARLREEYPDLTILHGAELNIGPDGGLDYDDDFLAGFDWCVASVHSHFDLPAAEQTERVTRAIAHPAVDVIGHLTGRMIGRRPGIELDAGAVFDAAEAAGTALEINCHLDRLDVPADLLRTARERPALRFVISTDSHHVEEYANLRWGVANARRGWIEAARVANTLPRDEFLAWVAAQRRVPNDDFYRIDTAPISVPQVDLAGWSLALKGMVGREVTLTYADILDMPMVERYITISCVSNEVGGGLVGNAKWLGVPLRDIVDLAGVGEGAEQLVGRSVDGFTVGLPGRGRLRRPGSAARHRYERRAASLRARFPGPAGGVGPVRVRLGHQVAAGHRAHHLGRIRRLLDPPRLGEGGSGQDAVTHRHAAGSGGGGTSGRRRGGMGPGSWHLQSRGADR
jgi:DNA polymerase (family X)